MINCWFFNSEFRNKVNHDLNKYLGVSRPNVNIIIALIDKNKQPTVQENYFWSILHAIRASDIIHCHLTCDVHK